MALQDKRKCYWHAFNALDEQKNDQVPKSKLKVLTFNTACTLGIKKAETGLTDFHSTPYLSFENYLYYLNIEVFQKLQEDIKTAALDKIDEVCWLICAKRYLKRDPRIIDDDGVFKLWMMFNFLAETNSNGEPLYPLFMDHEEVKFLLQRLVQILGCPWSDEALSEVSKQIKQFSFPAFLNVIETRYANGTDTNGMRIGVGELYEEFLMDIIKKGTLSKKGHLVKNVNERWFVLTPSKLRYFTNRSEKELKGEISLSNTSTVETLQNEKSRSFKFLVKGSDGKDLEIIAPDLRHKNEWVAAIQAAISHSERSESFRKSEFLARKKVRDKKRDEEEKKRIEEAERQEKQRQDLESARQAQADLEAKLVQEGKDRLEEKERLRREEEERRKVEEERLRAEEEKRRADEEQRKKEELEKEELQKQELERARKAHEELQAKLDEEARLRAEEQEVQRKMEEEMRQKQLELEARVQQEAELREAEQQRLKELEELNKKLEELLEMERQAKKDEEIVRALQSRLLEEEFAKREELERLKEQQDEVLERERQEKDSLAAQYQNLSAEKELLAEEKQTLAMEKSEKERILAEEKERLEKLEAERRAADAQLKEALGKLEQAERLRQELQARKREREKPIGLARPILPKPNPFLTHRGLGAFTEAEFEMRKQKSQESLGAEALAEVNDKLDDAQISNRSQVTSNDEGREEDEVIAV